MISAVGRAMEILDALVGDARGATVASLVSRLGIEKSVVSRVLATLEQDGYVVRDAETNTFRLGLRFVGIALRHLDGIAIWDICVPIIRKLSESTGELVQLAIVDGDGVTYVAKAEGTQRIRALPMMGSQAVLHASTAGRVWLASLPESRVIELIARSGLPKLTPYTIDSFEKLQAELARVRVQGYSTNVEELYESVNGVGVPICSPGSSTVIGALVVAAPAYRFGIAEMERALPAMFDVSNELGASLGGAVQWAIAREPGQAVAPGKRAPG